MSQINTNGIDVNYPVPGQNNSSQGFRDNFSQIKNNINTAATEITDLQNKAVLKAALNNSVLNNDMANVLISNASTSGFRATTYNLGNALAGTVLVDVNRADVQYGTVSGNVTFQFGGWAPTNTASNVALRLSIANANAVISLPSQCISSNNNYGVTLLENYSNISNTATLTAPANTEILEYSFSTLDCGNTITVAPLNRPYQATQVVTREISPTGEPGDVNGTIAVGPAAPQLTVTETIDTGNYVIVANTASLFVDMPVVFTGNTDDANSNIIAGDTYYVTDVANATAFTISTSAGGSDVDVGDSNVIFYTNPVAYLYVCTADFNSSISTKEATNTYASNNAIKLTGTANLEVNMPIVFSGNVFGGIQSNVVYYIKDLDSGNANITVSRSRVSGVAGSEITLSTANGNCVATFYYGGNDIWKRTTLSPW